MKHLLLLLALCLIGPAKADYKGTVPGSGTTFGGIVDGSSRNITQVAGDTFTVAVTPTVTASTYNAFVDMGGILTFAALPPSPGPYSGILQSITVKFKASVQGNVGFWVAVFSASPAGTFTDHTTAAIASADSTILLGMYHVNSCTSALGTHTNCNMDGIGKAVLGSSANLYVVVVPDATTIAPASTTDMIVELGMSWG